MVSKSWITLSRITIFQKAVCLPACHKVFVTNKCSSLLPFQAVTFWATLFSDDDKNMASLSRLISSEWCQEEEERNESEGKKYILCIYKNTGRYIHITIFYTEILIRKVDLWSFFHLWNERKYCICRITYNTLMSFMGKCFVPLCNLFSP